MTTSSPPGLGHHREAWADSAGVDLDAVLENLRERNRTFHDIDSTTIRRAGGIPIYSWRSRPGDARIIALSKLGFSADSSVAAVFWYNLCGQYCGGMIISFYTRRAGRWKPWHSIIYSQNRPPARR